MNNVITIDTITIKQDAEGRYSLNDLHKAAGGENRHKPSLYLRMDSTDELVNAIQCTDSCIPPIVAKRGFKGGTYVCPEVVIDYGMWISPKFALKVIRTFLKLEKELKRRDRCVSGPEEVAYLSAHPSQLSGNPERRRCLTMFSGDTSIWSLQSP